MYYPDFMVDSGPCDRIAKLHRLQYKALTIVNNGEIPKEKGEALERHYKLYNRPERRIEHI